MEKTEIHFKYILRREGLGDWKIDISKSGGGLCLYKSRTILLDEKYKDDLPMFLHEVAHATTKEKHTGMFADEFTKLVRKYMEHRPIIIN